VFFRLPLPGRVLEELSEKGSSYSDESEHSDYETPKKEKRPPKLRVIGKRNLKEYLFVLVYLFLVN
jgi:hypothetical protein